MNSSDPLCGMLAPARRTAIVDVGASPIDGSPPYRSMLTAGLCTVVGFEPSPAALNFLRNQQGPLETYLPYAIGDGSRRTLYVCASAGMSSLLRPDEAALSLFALFPKFGQVLSSEEVATRALDDITDIQALDLLKIDAQGAELMIFRSGKQKLRNAVAVHTEVSFVPLYESQPSFGEIDIELRQQGFIPHALADLKRWIIEPMRINNEPRRPLNQLLEADLVYVRDFRKPQTMEDEQWKHLALISHHCYRSYDLTLYCLNVLRQRGCIAQGAPAWYLNNLCS